MADTSFMKTNSNDLNIKELIDTIKSCFEKEDVKSADKYIKDYIELLVFKMISKSVFFGTFFMRMYRDIDYTLPAPAGVAIIKGYPRLSINPLIFFQLTISEQMAVLEHEVYHIMHFHLKRAESLKNIDDYEHYIINISMDCAINQYIEGLPEGTVTVKMLEENFQIAHLDRKREYEYYYEELKNSSQYKENRDKINQEKQEIKELFEKIKNKLQNGNSNSEQSTGGKGKSNKGKGNTNQGGGNKGSGKDNEEESLQDLIDQLMKKIAKYGIPDHSYWENTGGVDSDEMENILKDFINDVAAKCRGKLPADIQAIIDKLNKPAKISWQDEFKKITGSFKYPSKKTPLRRSRRQPDRYDVPGEIATKKLRICAAIDTSGSMSDNDISYIFNEIFAIIKSIKFQLTIVECDAKIGRVYTAKSQRDVDTKVTGRGGTAFSPVFEYVKTAKENFDVLIYFTDGYGEHKLTVVPKRIPTLFVLTRETNNLSLEDKTGFRIRNLYLDK